MTVRRRTFSRRVGGRFSLTVNFPPFYLIYLAFNKNIIRRGDII